MLAISSVQSDNLREMVVTEVNLRFELRAYEGTNACRLASLLLELTSGSGSTTRDAVATRWAERYRRHAALTGRKNIRSRMSNALVLLKVAQIVQTQGDNIVVVNADRLHLAASNLEIVEDFEGMAVPPGRWTSRPAVPEHLLAVQTPLEQLRQTKVSGEDK